MAFTYLEKTTHRYALHAEEWHSCFLEVRLEWLAAGHLHVVVFLLSSPCVVNCPQTPDILEIQI